MKDCVYVFYNKLSKRYENVVSFATDAVMINTLQNAKFKRETYEVCKIGEIDISNGTLETFAPVRIDVPTVEAEPLPTSEAGGK